MAATSKAGAGRAAIPTAIVRFALAQFSIPRRILLGLGVGRGHCQNRMPGVQQLALLNQAFEYVDGRREVFVTLAEGHQLNPATNGVKLAFDVLDTPAIKGQRGCCNAHVARQS